MAHMDFGVLQVCKILKRLNMTKKEISVLFVCLGNICRSPAGEGILKFLSQKDPLLDLHVESCGIGDWHVGQGPDRRMQEAAMKRGIHLSSRAQQFQERFFDLFDYILVADKEVLKWVYHQAKTAEQKAKIHLMTAFSTLYIGQEVPDPYYKPNGAFDLVLDMLEESCRGLIRTIHQHADKT